MIPHSEDAVQVTQYVANFFVRWKVFLEMYTELGRNFVRKKVDFVQL